jgi:hypothetical protein
MDNNRITRVLLGAKLEAKRKAGRPKLRLLDDLQAVIKMTEIKGWRRKAQDRSEWMDFIREDKVKLQYAPHNNVSVNDGPHIRRMFHKILIL